MSEEQVVTEAATYDAAAVQAKWQPVWEELQPFRADDDVVRSGTREKRYALTMFPYPSGDLHMGHAEVFALHDVIARYWWQRGYEVLNPMGFDSFGLNAENAAIRDNAHPATFTYENIAVSTESCKKFGVSFDWTPHPQHLRPRVLPLDPVAVPEVARARPGLPQEQPGQLVPLRPDGAGQRAGHRRPLRALRQRGHQARADAVVLQDHRVRPGAAGRPGRPGADLARARHQRAAELDRPLRGRPRQLPGRRARPHRGVHDSARHAVRSDVHGRGGRCRAGRRAGHRRAATGVRRLPGRGAQGQRHRAAVHRPPEDRGVPGRPRDQPGDRHGHPGVRRRLRAGRLRHRRDHGRAGPGPARLGLRRGLRPADHPHRPAARGLGGEGVHRRRAGRQLPQRLGWTWTAWASPRPSAR